MTKFSCSLAFLCLLVSSLLLVGFQEVEAFAVWTKNTRGRREMLPGKTEVKLPYYCQMSFGFAHIADICEFVKLQLIQLNATLV